MEVLENEYSKIWLEGDIYFAIYKKGTVIGLKQAKEIVQLRKQLTKGATVKGLVYIGNVNTVSPDARKYLASDESTEGFEKMAFINKSLMVKLIGNAFIKIDKPKIPTRIFTNDVDARQWLLNG